MWNLDPRALVAQAATDVAGARTQELLDELCGTIAEDAQAALRETVQHAAAGWRHYRRARFSAGRVEAAEALTRALASFSAARRTLLDYRQQTVPAGGAVIPAAADALTGGATLLAWCDATCKRVASLREQLTAGGIDDLPPL